MDNSNLAEVRVAYKHAVDEWVLTGRAEEYLAAPDHSKKARDAQRDALRQANMGS
jgi:hypothetical protein